MEKFTPMRLLVEALERCIDNDMGGQVIECSVKDIYLRDPVEYANENARFLIEDMTRF